MHIKKRISNLIADSSSAEAIAGEAKQELAQHHTAAAKNMLEKIVAASTKELREINDILENLSYDDEDVLRIIGELNSSCKTIIKKAKVLLAELEGEISEDRQAEILQLLTQLEELERSKSELERNFYKMKVVDFEEVVEDEELKIPKKETLGKLASVKAMWEENSKSTDLQNAKKLAGLIDTVGHKKAQKYFDRIFFFVRRGDKTAREMEAANPDNKLVKESQWEATSGDREAPQTSNKVTIPFPEKGYPAGFDLVVILSAGMSFTAFIAVLTGGGLTWLAGLIGAALGSGGLGALAAIAIVVGLITRFRIKTVTRYTQISKKVANFISYYTQTGQLPPVYTNQKLISPGKVDAPKQIPAPKKPKQIVAPAQQRAA
ncbi:hypothetical protein CMO91_06450 [Candidatus Woesearchaeota archaeon]|nr:hypothetical protein [Candidatus Woesearchaeota archaeon]|tara:strand:- start:1497 stop:2627 length:1131 start_codon:yes stop_codon:yes gene_type:complete